MPPTRDKINLIIATTKEKAPTTLVFSIEYNQKYTHKKTEYVDEKTCRTNKNKLKYFEGVFEHTETGKMEHVFIPM